MCLIVDRALPSAICGHMQGDKALSSCCNIDQSKMGINTSVQCLVTGLSANMLITTVEHKRPGNSRTDVLLFACHAACTCYAPSHCLAKGFWHMRMSHAQS